MSTEPGQHAARVSPLLSVLRQRRGAGRTPAEAAPVEPPAPGDPAEDPPEEAGPAEPESMKRWLEGRPVNRKASAKPPILREVSALAGEADVVLIDAPSPGLHTDIGPLARQVDGVLLCMRAGRSSIGQAVATSSAVRSAGGELFGIAITVNAADADERRASTVAGDAFAEH